MYNLTILTNENNNDHLPWIKACEKYPLEINYRVINLTKANWLNEILKAQVDYFLAKPGGLVESFKQLYDERISILVKELGFKVYPSLDEILIYENKRYLSFWLEAYKVPHPVTNTFYYREEAMAYLQYVNFPVVAKLNIGASGNGVKIMKTKLDAEKYIDKIFNKGISARTGPRLDIGNYGRRLLRKMFHLSELKTKLSTYKTIASHPQQGYCLFQDFVSHSYEWRAVRIGESYFAHKKIVKGEKASGMLIKNYDNPPQSLLSFVREITDKAGFRSLAIDIFETGKDAYLVNEMQCIFGQSDPYQMLINGKPGRYIYIDNEWHFEEGMFNTNESYDLRLQDVIHLLKRN